jgi:hypothetical protein
MKVMGSERQYKCSDLLAGGKQFRIGVFNKGQNTSNSLILAAATCTATQNGQMKGEQCYRAE